MCASVGLREPLWASVGLRGLVHSSGVQIGGLHNVSWLDFSSSARSR